MATYADAQRQGAIDDDLDPDDLVLIIALPAWWYCVPSSRACPPAPPTPTWQSMRGVAPRWCEPLSDSPYRCTSGFPTDRRRRALAVSAVTAVPDRAGADGEGQNSGPSQTIPVTTVESSAELDALHASFVRAVEEFEPDFENSEYTGEGYPPHVTIKRHERINSGDRLVSGSWPWSSWNPSSRAADMK